MNFIKKLVRKLKARIALYRLLREIAKGHVRDIPTSSVLNVSKLDDVLPESLRNKASVKNTVYLYDEGDGGLQLILPSTCIAVSSVYHDRAVAGLKAEMEAIAADPDVEVVAYLIEPSIARIEPMSKETYLLLCEVNGKPPVITEASWCAFCFLFAYSKSERKALSHTDFKLKGRRAYMDGLIPTEKEWV